MLQYKPPKSSVWGHLLRKMPAQRAKARFEEFLATAVAGYTFGSATLLIQDTSGQVVPRYEQLIGTPALNGCSFPSLTHDQSNRCLEQLITDEAVAGNYALAQLFQISRWRVDGLEVPTSSAVTIHYGQLSCLSTFFQFETVEQFHAIQRELAEIRLCQLNEKHLKPVSS